MEEEEESSEWGDIEIERQVITAETIQLDEVSAEEQLRLSHLAWGGQRRGRPGAAAEERLEGLVSWACLV